MNGRKENEWKGKGRKRGHKRGGKGRRKKGKKKEKRQEEKTLYQFLYLFTRGPRGRGASLSLACAPRSPEALVLCQMGERLPILLQ